MMKIKITKPIASAWLAYLLSALVIVMVVCFGFSIHRFYIHEYFNGAILLAIPIVILGVMAFCDNHFAWIAGGTLEYKDNKLIYTYMEVVDVMGNNNFKYTISRVDSYKRRGRDVVIKGEILKKKPIFKAKPCRKCRVYDITDEAMEYLEDKINELSVHQSKSE